MSKRKKAFKKEDRREEKNVRHKRKRKYDGREPNIGSIFKHVATSDRRRGMRSE